MRISCEFYYFDYKNPILKMIIFHEQRKIQKQSKKNIFILQNRNIFFTFVLQNKGIFFTQFLSFSPKNFKKIIFREITYHKLITFVLKLHILPKTRFYFTKNYFFEVFWERKNFKNWVKKISLFSKQK